MYIPPEAEGDPGHVNCEFGVVCWTTEKLVGVKYNFVDGWSGAREQVTTPFDLIKIVDLELQELPDGEHQSL